LIPPGTGWTLFNVTGINDGGQIVGNGAINGKVHPYLLTPDTGRSVALLTVVRQFSEVPAVTFTRAVPEGQPTDRMALQPVAEGWGGPRPASAEGWVGRSISVLTGPSTAEPAVPGWDDPLLGGPTG